MWGRLLNWEQIELSLVRCGWRWTTNNLQGQEFDLTSCGHENELWFSKTGCWKCGHTVIWSKNTESNAEFSQNGKKNKLKVFLTSFHQHLPTCSAQWGTTLMPQDDRQVNVKFIFCYILPLIGPAKDAGQRLCLPCKPLQTPRGAIWARNPFLTSDRSDQEGSECGHGQGSSVCLTSWENTHGHTHSSVVIHHQHAFHTQSACGCQRRQYWFLIHLKQRPTGGETDKHVGKEKAKKKKKNTKRSVKKKNMKSQMELIALGGSKSFAPLDLSNSEKFRYF